MPAVKNLIGFGALWIHTALKHAEQRPERGEGFGALWIHTALKLYLYNQTNQKVSEPSGFTLLSNSNQSKDFPPEVSEPSGFTLLSNGYSFKYIIADVSEPSGFTLLSNTSLTDE